MFRSDNKADGSTVEKREANIRQAFQSGGKGASHISESAAADSGVTIGHGTTAPAANRV
jgi:hypothetical protein